MILMGKRELFGLFNCLSHVLWQSVFCGFTTQCLGWSTVRVNWVFPCHTHLFYWYNASKLSRDTWFPTMWHLTQTTLCSLILSLETTNDVLSVAWYSLNIQATSKGSDQTARMRRLIWGFAGRTYDIVGNLTQWLNCYSINLSAWDMPHVMIDYWEMFPTRISDISWVLKNIVVVYGVKIAIDKCRPYDTDLWMEDEKLILKGVMYLRHVHTWT